LRKYDEQLGHAATAKQQMDSDMEMEKTDPNIETLTYDLQNEFSLPRIPTNIVFYKPQLSIYKLGIHDGKNNKGFFNVWTESEGGRGAQDVGSVILKHINSNVSDTVRHLILWPDSCGGQNRNIRITLMMMHMLPNNERLETVTFKFWVSGHSSSSRTTVTLEMWNVFSVISSDSICQKISFKS